MSGSEAAALIVAITGALGAIFAGARNLRGDKIKHEVEAAAAVLTGYTNLAATLQAELERMKESYEIDRKAWNEERTEMRLQHAEEMKALREDHREEMVLAYERIDELGTQLYVMTNRPPDSRDRLEDKEQK